MISTVYIAKNVYGGDGLGRLGDGRVVFVPGAWAGEQVKASCGGTVTAVYDDEYLGTTVVISHPDGYSTQYANLAAMPTVRAGDSVSAGDVIGAVGATALLEIGEQPHLHFSVFHNGESVDPAAFIGK